MTQATNPFGQLLRRARMATKLTRQALAQQVNLNDSYIYRLEKGARKPSREVVLLLAETLKVDGESLNQWLLAAGLAPISIFSVGGGAFRTRGGARFQKIRGGLAPEASAASLAVQLESIGLQESTLGRLFQALDAERPAAREQATRIITDTVSYLLNTLGSPVQTAVIPAAKKNPFVASSVMQRIMLRAIAEAANAGIKDVILILAPGMVESIYVPLRAVLDVAIVPQVKLRYCLQPQPEGLGDAVLLAENLVGGKPFALVLPDDLVNEHAGMSGHASELRRMIEALAQQPEGNFVSVVPVPKSKMAQYGVAVVGAPEQQTNYQPITRLVEKPDQESSMRLPNETYGIVGRYILQPEIFLRLRELKERGERPVQLTTALDLLLDSGHHIYAIELKASRQDLGEMLTKANAAIAAYENEPPA